VMLQERDYILAAMRMRYVGEREEALFAHVPAPAATQCVAGECGGRWGEGRRREVKAKGSGRKDR